MNWEAIGAIGELAGAIGVIVTLVYLAIQIRQNSYFHHKQGYTGPTAWNTSSRNMDQYMRLRGVHAWWQRTQHIYDPEFRDYINAKRGPDG